MTLYGEDARTFLLACLICELTEQKGHNQPQKVRCDANEKSKWTDFTRRHRHIRTRAVGLMQAVLSGFPVLFFFLFFLFYLLLFLYIIYIFYHQIYYIYYHLVVVCPGGHVCIRNLVSRIETLFRDDNLPGFITTEWLLTHHCIFYYYYYL